MEQLNLITVLDDGDTFTSLEGCTVKLLTQVDLERAAESGPGAVRAVDIFSLWVPSDLRRLADLLEASGAE